MKRMAKEKLKSNFSPVTPGHKKELEKITGKENISINEALEEYSHDYTEDLQYLPELVVKPCNTKEVSEIVKYCNQENIALTPRGGGTGLSGGALPVYGGIVLSTERLNRILQIDDQNFQATVEPGVINQVFKEKVREKGLFYPPDPASQGSCFLGGNLGENAGGPGAIKYGVTKDYVLNLEVVLPTGEVIQTGANTLKNATGYNLTQLIIGSEGTLGIITRIVFRLIPPPGQDLLMLAAFPSARKACEAVPAILLSGITPSALEFMERPAIDWTMEFTDIQFPVKDNIQAHLLIEVDGNDQEALFKDCEKITEILEKYQVAETYFADSDYEKDRLWKLRRNVAEAVHANSVYKEEDTVVPRSRLPDLLEKVKATGKKFGFDSVCYGHAGDGNLHVNVIKGSLDEEAWQTTVKQGIREIFHHCKSLGGTISGEHGIGFVQREYMNIPFSSAELSLMKKIKETFDPNGILNPGKILKE